MDDERVKFKCATIMRSITGILYFSTSTVEARTRDEAASLLSKMHGDALHKVVRLSAVKATT